MYKDNIYDTFRDTDSVRNKNRIRDGENLLDTGNSLILLYITANFKKSFFNSFI